MPAYLPACLLTSHVFIQHYRQVELPTTHLKYFTQHYYRQVELPTSYFVSQHYRQVELDTMFDADAISLGAAYKQALERTKNGGAVLLPAHLHGKFT